MEWTQFVSVKSAEGKGRGEKRPEKEEITVLFKGKRLKYAQMCHWWLLPYFLQ